jgi:lipoprotein-anchoring transpeptidase ErfK/SrfK
MDRANPVALVFVPLFLSGCGVALQVPTVTLETSNGEAVSAASITARPSGGAPVKPGEPIIVTAIDGHLADVDVIGPKGPLPGIMSDDGTRWQADVRSLRYNSTYRVEARAIDARGVETTSTNEFSTVSPSKFFTGEVVSPAPGSTVGVGMPLVVSFNRPIKNRADVERALIVRTPTSFEGAWSWRDGTTVEFRPKSYWPGNIPVEVIANFQGLESSKDVYGKGGLESSFNIGPSMVTKVDAATHEAQVLRDGAVIRTIPITTGKLGFETRSGTKVIVSKERTRIMDAATGGTDRSDPEYYRLTVEYAMRVTYSGEFVHAAPWSVGSQGRANVSHGCIGMSTSNAQWLYDQTLVGDVVEVTGTSNVQDLGNGITVWNESWPQWLARSATGSVSTVATDEKGSSAKEVSEVSMGPMPVPSPAPAVGGLTGSIVPGVPGLGVAASPASPSANVPAS